MTDQPGRRDAMLRGAGALVVLATFNERETLPQTVARLRAAVPEAQILVVDDSSPDGTGQWVEEAAKSDPMLRLLSRPSKQGIGSAVKAGLQRAIDEGFELVINLDADQSHEPESIPAMLEAIADASSADPVDVVVGSRYRPGGSIHGWPVRRHVMSRGVNLAARLLLGLGVTDCSGSFRVYRTSILKEVDLATIESRGFAFFEEILWRITRVGGRFREVPIRFIERQQGSSKISTREILSALRMLTTLGSRHWLGSKH